MSESKVIEAKLPCPVCPSSDAYHIYDDGHGYCFSCEHYEHPNRGEFNITDDTFTYEFIPLRGLNKSTLEFYDIRTKIDAKGKPVSLGFRYPNGSYKVRSFDKKDFHTIGEIGKAGVYGQDLFSAGAHRYITITEGEFDAASIYQATGGPAVSVRSATSAVADCSISRSFLNSFERIYLAFDNDAKGREATAAVAKLFDFNKVFHVKFTKRKDANEYLQHGEQDELKRIWWNSKQYLPDNLISSFSDYKEALDKETSKGIPYPFKTLTKKTYGIRTGEAVLIAAPEKVGKTEVMHAIEYQLLQHTDCPIGAIFLEEPVRRHVQAVAGLHLKKRVHLPDSGVSNVEVLNAFQEAVREDDRLHVYSHFGSDDPDVFLDLVRYLVTARGCRYILFDHLSMVVSGDMGDDERKALDYLSTRLEMMVKELDFGLICVSHVNDEGQTRGSRYLTKVFDITIQLKRDLMNDDPIERSTVHFSIPYNRFCGDTGPAGSAIMNHKTGILEEVADDGTDLCEELDLCA